MPGYIARGDDYGEDTLFHVERPPLKRDVFHLSKNQPETSVAMAEKALPKTGTLRATIYGIIDRSPDGYTCDEMEIKLNRSHQSVSATFNSLKRDDWIVDSGRRRATRYGNLAIVWVATKGDN